MGCAAPLWAALLAASVGCAALLTASVSNLLSCRVTEKMKAGSGDVTGTRKGVGQPSGTPRAGPEQSGRTGLADGVMVRSGNAADQRAPVKYRAGDNITLPDFPQPGQFRTWKLNVQRPVLAAFGRYGEASARLRNFIEEVVSQKVAWDTLS